MREYLLDCRLNKISPELLKSAEVVVEIAMEKLKKGYIRRTQRRIALLYKEGMRIYELADAQVALHNNGQFYSIGNMGEGLFISGIQLDKEGYQLSRLKDIELPRDTLEVTPGNLTKLKSINPRGIARLATELIMAREFDDRKYPKR